ncbi:MAG: flagellar biosynthesis protein FlhF [Bacillota bacterium]|nr:flagellar biosynthesis protein FlhF [Bacillota bacterium]
MKIKKFTAGSMPDAMKTVRNELGHEAVILNSRIIYTGGFLGFFRKKNFEVIAAVDPKVEQDFKTSPKEKGKKVSAIRSESRFEKKSIEEENSNINISQSSKENDLLIKEINELKSLIKLSNSESKPLLTAYPEPIQGIQNWMYEQELSPTLKNRFLTALTEKWFTLSSNEEKGDTKKILKEEMFKFLSDKHFGGVTFTKKFVNVLGPTGVGKTTTLAKIAADCVLNHKKKVAFITTDTYRIAAIDQLKTYAQILNIPLEVCYSLEDFKAATIKFNHYDVVLIDTAGRNFRNKKYIDDLFQVIDFEMEMETFLVLALTAKQKDMEDIFEQFSAVGISKFIFTKADETSVYGSMMNMMEKFNIGVAYVTTGQNVPDDMISASSEVISNLLIEGY